MAQKLDEFDIIEADTYLDTDLFKAYVEKVRAIIAAEAAPIGTRDIHRRLKTAAKPEWTADALEAIGDIEAVGVLPTRYRISTFRRRVIPPTPFGRAAR